MDYIIYTYTHTYTHTYPAFVTLLQTLVLCVTVDLLARINSIRTVCFKLFISLTNSVHNRGL